MAAHIRFGEKRTSKVEARVTDTLKLELQRKCNDVGISESDYIDRLISISLFGFEHVASLEQQKLKKVCGLSGMETT